MDRIRDAALQVESNISDLGDIQNNKFVALICAVSIILLGVGLGTSEMIYGTIKYKTRATGTIETVTFDVGLWTYKDNTTSYGTCAGWPESDSDLCTAVRATRAFMFLAILCAAVGVVGSIVRMLADKEHYKASMLASGMLLLTAVFSMVGYSIWQHNCQQEFGEAFQEEYYPNATIEVERRWTTVGYSYCFFLWTWIWAFSFLMFKLANPTMTQWLCGCKGSDKVKGADVAAF